VLILVPGLRRGEALGLTWPDVSFDAAEVDIRWQLQRADHQIRHRETKTPGSAAVLPLPDIWLTALSWSTSPRIAPGRDRAAACAGRASRRSRRRASLAAASTPRLT